MDFSYQHGQSQRVLRQRNVLGVAALGLTGAVIALLFYATSRPREIVLQPVLQSPVTISSSGVSHEYLEMVTRDTALLMLNRSPGNLDYWMTSVLNLVAPRAQGRIKADLVKIVSEQRGSSVSQFFAIETMSIDTKNLRSTVNGKLNTIVGQQVVSSDMRTFEFQWEYSGLSLKLIGFGLVTPKKPGEAQ